MCVCVCVCGRGRREGEIRRGLMVVGMNEVIFFDKGRGEIKKKELCMLERSVRGRNYYYYFCYYHYCYYYHFYHYYYL